MSAKQKADESTKEGSPKEKNHKSIPTNGSDRGGHTINSSDDNNHPPPKSRSKPKSSSKPKSAKPKRTPSKAMLSHAVLDFQLTIKRNAKQEEQLIVNVSGQTRKLESNEESFYYWLEDMMLQA
jgi:hypothetical protein